MAAKRNPGALAGATGASENVQLGGERSEVSANRPYPQGLADPLEPDLLREWQAAVDAMSGRRHHLRALGISIEAEARAGWIGFERIRTTGRGYVPDAAGTGALIVGLWAGETPSIYATGNDFVLVDLIAFTSADPSRWWFRRGEPVAALGNDLLHLAHDSGHAITLHENPLAWLQAECRGACLLEWLEACRAVPAALEVAA